MTKGDPIRSVPAYVVNGISVALGVALVQLTLGAVAGARFVEVAGTGAVLASFPHLTGRSPQTLRRCLVGGGCASLAMGLVVAAASYPGLRGLVVAQIAFLALLGLAWGARAGALVFSVIIGIVFALARPRGDSAAFVAAGSACGAVLYAAWAYLSNKLLEPRYRELAVAAAVDAAGQLLGARARVLFAPLPVEEGEGEDARFGQLGGELALAQALQSARDLVYPAATARGGARQTAILWRLSELREVVLTSRLDLELLGDDSAARFTRARLAVALRGIGQALVALAAALREGEPERAPSEDWAANLPVMREAEPLLAGDARARLLPVIAARLSYLCEEVEAIRQLVVAGPVRHSLSPLELEQSLSDEDTWPLRVPLEHLTLDSPVLRHAARSALALACVYYLTYLMPWTTRPHWLLLSVAVVLRGTLEETLSRRNARVLGTAIGCLFAASVLRLIPHEGLRLLFFAAVGTAHAFVNVRYLLTAIAATTMALLQAHFAAPGLSFVVVERLLDTVLGALLAWGFSYVLPSWERRTLPASLERTFEALADYASLALNDAAQHDAQRLARQRAYDALALLASAVRRTAAEPARVRLPTRQLVLSLDHAQRLMAHLSSVRSLITRRSRSLPGDAAHSALENARRSVLRHLSLPERDPVDVEASAAPELGDLPQEPVDRLALPWLERRLEASLYDATRAGRWARAALASTSEHVKIVA